MSHRESIYISESYSAGVVDDNRRITVDLRVFYPRHTTRELIDKAILDATHRALSESRTAESEEAPREPRVWQSFSDVPRATLVRDDDGDYWRRNVFGGVYALTRYDGSWEQEIEPGAMYAPYTEVIG